MPIEKEDGRSSHCMVFESFPDDSPSPYEEQSSPTAPESPLLPMIPKEKHFQQSTPGEASDSQGNYGTMERVDVGEPTQDTITNPPTTPAN